LPIPLNIAVLTGTTGSDVLYVGVPVITLPSARTLGRMGASLLSRVGLSGLIARSEDDFVRIAAALMRNRTA
jgi:predicted O-linked N-acetylglucosamine transferase (SPINDLY family)